MHAFDSFLDDPLYHQTGSIKMNKSCISAMLKKGHATSWFRVRCKLWVVDSSNVTEFLGKLGLCVRAQRQELTSWATQNLTSLHLFFIFYFFLRSSRSCEAASSLLCLFVKHTQIGSFSYKLLTSANKILEPKTQYLIDCKQKGEITKYLLSLSSRLDLLIDTLTLQSS